MFYPVAQAAAFLSSTIEKDPGSIMGPIDAFLGYILNFIFNIVYFITEPNSLGITIIIFTLLTRFLMVPSGIKTQKSMLVMRKLQPEINKIKEKYGKSKDAETQRKMNAEIQALYAKHHYSPFGGCLPMFITLPIFYALSYLLRQPYMFVDRIGTIYNQLAIQLYQIPHSLDILAPFVDKHKGKLNVDIRLVTDMVKALNKFTSAEWSSIMSQFASTSTSDQLQSLQSILSQKTNLETFFGLNLLNISGFGFPGIIIPILSAGTQVLSAYYNYRINPPADSSQKSTQMIMMVGMPLFMGWITASFSIGVGIYWITGNIFFFLQQVVITRYLINKQKRKESVT